MKKIVIKVDMHSDKSRTKALKIAATAQGVNSVSLEGESRDQVVVTGDVVDSVCLANRLRKKFCCANIISVQDLKPEDAGNTKNQETPPTENVPANCYSPYWQCPPSCPLYNEAVYDPKPNSCSIL